jgi:hypothetical protein
LSNESALGEVIASLLEEDAAPDEGVPGSCLQAEKIARLSHANARGKVRRFMGLFRLRLLG